MFESESVFVDPVSVEVAFGLYPMTATSAVQCLIVGVVEGAVSGVDFGLAVGLGAPGRIPGGDPLGIGFEPASHRLFLPSPASALAAGRTAFVWLLRNFFRAALSTESGGPARRFLDARSGALHGRDKRSGRRSRWRGRAGGASAPALVGGGGEGAWKLSVVRRYRRPPGWWVGHRFSTPDFDFGCFY
jgi:hypothetical protein